MCWKERRGSCGSGYCCGSKEVEKRLLRERHYSVEIQRRLLREQILLQQCRNIDKAPAGAGTAVAVGKRSKEFCGNNHCYGRVEIQGRLLWERTLLRQCGNTVKAPAGADTTAAV
ncbi:hypothetical protein ROHU_009665 [Labeo rohita]|uniref:Uncharacterized protein n=1 Tax=Labeo rohita TaxID=84645 RepID=A0A498M1W7_LABRO|nr:hypothetical protein ROHU_035104 [Labeo rohita]RXN13476.1 hypothetical protein ROHU_009665 [Labeo rohita]